MTDEERKLHDSDDYEDVFSALLEARAVARYLAVAFHQLGVNEEAYAELAEKHPWLKENQ